MSTPNKGALELTWVGKDQALIPAAEGRYGYDWVDPADPRASEVRQVVIDRTIGEPGGPHGAGQNLLVTGDSIDVLRALVRIPELRDRYLGKVKLCYIDPPFNTGGAFGAYDDALEHSIWLTMMRDRIRLIKRLLAADGSIWVHLDDSENHRMRLLLDEEFGAANFVAEVVWEMTDLPQLQSEHFSVNADTVVVYRKTDAFRSNRFTSTAVPSHYDRVGDDGTPYFTRTLRQTGPGSARSDRESMWFPIEAPDGTEVWPIREDGSEGRWRWGRSTVAARAEEIDWQRPRGRWDPHSRTPWSGSTSRPAMTIWPYRETGSNRTAKAEIKALKLDERAFDTPKPERLLERIIHIATDPGDLVLDCFAGSGTTAAVAHKMGRRWVTCELLPDNVERFTLPRLRKVVDGEDTGGISTATTRAPAAGIEIPGGVTPDEAQTFQSLLRRIADGLEGLDPTTLAALRKATRTRDVVETRWSGGGGFTVATLAPSMYEVVDGEPYLSVEATNGAFARHVAGQLGFRFEDAAPFCGRRGRRRLAVIDGFVSGIDVATIISGLGESESVRIIAKGFDEDAERALSAAPRGSTIERAPDYLRANGGRR